MSGSRNKTELFASLPTAWPENLLPQIRQAVTDSKRKLIVLDDDPTGTQTIYDLPVLTTWDVDTLRAELQAPGSCFFILTNSRSLTGDAAYALNVEIAENLKLAAAGTDAGFSIISRSDSTLRGHFPGEIQALAEVLGRFDAIILIPYFEAGGRFTVDDIHYVAEGDTLVPAAKTPFAGDAAFGYHSSDLREWVVEKHAGAIPVESVTSISIADLRKGGPKRVCEKLLAIRPGSACVVNAACPRDLESLVAGLLAAEAHGRNYIFRTAASFVSARLGLEPRPLWKPSPVSRSCGGLTVVGSYVPKTTMQLAGLLECSDVERVELSVGGLLGEQRKTILSDAIRHMNDQLASGRDVVVYTSRDLITGPDVATSLDIGGRISAALVEVVHGLEERPRYLIAKGGITSSDVATRSLGVKRANVLGQILPGVPVWELGPETKFPGMPYIVFPGNVGDADALKEAVNRLRHT